MVSTRLSQFHSIPPQIEKIDFDLVREEDQTFIITHDWVKVMYNVDEMFKKQYGV